MAKKSTKTKKSAFNVSGTFIKELMTQRLLVISLEESVVRAVILEKDIRGTSSVSNYAEVLFESTGRSSRVKITQILDKLSTIEVSDVVLLSEDVEFFPVDITKQPSKKLSAAAFTRMQNLAKREIASYLDGSPELYHVSCIRTGQCDSEADFDFTQDTQAETEPVLVFSVRKMVYSGYESFLKSHKKRLVGMASPEISAWGMCQTITQTGVHIVADWGRNSIVAALITHGTPKRIIREAIPTTDTQMALLDTISRDLLEDLPAPEEVIIGGEMAESLETQQTENALQIEIWSLQDEFPSIQGVKNLPARYMSLVSAAIHFSKNTMELAICINRVPLSKFVKENVHAVPAIILGLLIMGISAEYFQLKHQETKLINGITTFEEEKKELTERIADKEAIEKRYSAQKNELSKMNNNTEALNTTFPALTRSLAEVYNGFIEQSPGDIQLLLLEQFSDEIFHIDGRTKNIQSLQLFPIQLKKIAGINDIKLLKSEEQIKNVEGSSRQERFYYFRIRFRLKGATG